MNNTKKNKEKMHSNKSAKKSMNLFKKTLNIFKVKSTMGKVIVGVFVFLFVFYALYWVGLYINRPVLVKVTNIGAHSATITWITKKPEPGLVMYSDGSWAYKLPYPFGRLFAKIGFDDRDFSLAELSKIRTSKNSYARAEKVAITKLGKYYVHVVTLKGLAEKRMYKFKVGNGFLWWGDKWFKSNADNAIAGSSAMQNNKFVFTTLNELSSLQRPNPSFGSVVTYTGQPVKDGFVVSYLSFVPLDSGKTISPISAPLASALTDEGTFYIDLANARTLFTGKQVKAGDDNNLYQIVEVYTKNGLVAKQSVTLNENAPMPDIIVSPKVGTISAAFKVHALPNNASDNFSDWQEQATASISEIAGENINIITGGTDHPNMCMVDGHLPVPVGMDFQDPTNNQCYTCVLDSNDNAVLKRKAGNCNTNALLPPTVVPDNVGGNLIGSQATVPEPTATTPSNKHVKLVRPSRVQARCSMGQDGKYKVDLNFRDGSLGECAYKLGKLEVTGNSNTPWNYDWKKINGASGVNRMINVQDPNVQKDKIYQYVIQVLGPDATGKCTELGPSVKTPKVRCGVGTNTPSYLGPPVSVTPSVTWGSGGTGIGAQTVPSVGIPTVVVPSGPGISVTPPNVSVPTITVNPPTVVVPSGAPTNINVPTNMPTGTVNFPTITIPSVAVQSGGNLISSLSNGGQSDLRTILKAYSQGECKETITLEQIINTLDPAIQQQALQVIEKRINTMAERLEKRYGYKMEDIKNADVCTLIVTKEKYKNEMLEKKEELLKKKMYLCDELKGMQLVDNDCKPIRENISNLIPVSEKDAEYYKKLLNGKNMLQPGDVDDSLYKRLRKKMLFKKQGDQEVFDIDSIYQIALARRVKDGNDTVTIRSGNRAPIKACPINKKRISVFNLDTNKAVALCSPTLTSDYEKYNPSKLLQKIQQYDEYYAYPIDKLCKEGKTFTKPPANGVAGNNGSTDRATYRMCKMYNQSNNVWRELYECAKGYVATENAEGIYECVKKRPNVIPAQPANGGNSGAFLNSFIVRAQGSQTTDKAEGQFYIYTADGNLEFKSPGVYTFEYDGKTYQVNINNTSTEYEIYIDKNSNNKRDPGEPLLDEVTKGVARVKLDPKKVEFEYVLNPGYNFVHFPFVFEDKSLAKATQLLKYLRKKGEISLIAHYDGKWHTVDQFKVVGGDGYMQDSDFDITPGKGYVIRNLGVQPVTVKIWGYPVDGAVSVFFFRGWNLVGFYNKDKTYTASTLIDSINSTKEINVINVTKWDSGRYDGLQKEDKTYGFDFPIYWQNAYFVNVKDIKDANTKLYTWTGE